MRRHFLQPHAAFYFSTTICRFTRPGFVWLNPSVPRDIPVVRYFTV